MLLFVLSIILISCSRKNNENIESLYISENEINNTYEENELTIFKTFFRNNIYELSQDNMNRILGQFVPSHSITEQTRWTESNYSWGIENTVSTNGDNIIIDFGCSVANRIEGFDDYLFLFDTGLLFIITNIDVISENKFKLFVGMGVFSNEISDEGYFTIEFSNDGYVLIYYNILNIRTSPHGNFNGITLWTKTVEPTTELKF